MPFPFHLVLTRFPDRRKLVIVMADDLEKRVKELEEKVEKLEKSAERYSAAPRVSDDFVERTAAEKVSEMAARIAALEARN
jgi:cell division septum initiation protein DivIVA